MRKISCAIVDDEPLALKLMESFVERTPFLSLEGVYSDSVDAMGSLKANPVDLVFLDIQMPDMDGMELSHVLPSDTRVIFTTAFKEYAFDSYDVSAIDYLLKPIRYDKFFRASEKAMEWFALRENADAVPPQGYRSQAGDAIFVRVDGELRRVALDSIVMVEGMRDYVRIHVEESRKALITHLTMRAMEEKLPSAGFMRVSRSHIVSLSHIRSIDRNMCIYIGDTMLRVTDMYREGFEKYLNGLIAK